MITQTGTVVITKEEVIVSGFCVDGGYGGYRADLEVLDWAIEKLHEARVTAERNNDGEARN